MTLTIYNQPQLFPLIPAGGAIDPEVDVIITSLAADVEATDKTELVIKADIAA